MVQFELTPLVDMMFILLVFFMVGAVFIKPAISMTLPALEQAYANTSQPSVYVSIDRYGDLFINHDRVDAAQFHDVFEKLYIDQKVIVSADKDVSYERFLKVLVLLNEFDLKDIDLEHEFEVL